MSEFSNDTPIHIVMPANKYNEMYEVSKNIEGVTREQLWETINENTILKQENYMLKAQLEQIRRVLKSE